MSPSFPRALVNQMPPWGASHPLPDVSRHPREPPLPAGGPGSPLTGGPCEGQSGLGLGGCPTEGGERTVRRGPAIARLQGGRAVL